MNLVLSTICSDGEIQSGVCMCVCVLCALSSRCFLLQRGTENRAIGFLCLSCTPSIQGPIYPNQEVGIQVLHRLPGLIIVAMVARGLVSFSSHRRTEHAVRNYFGITVSSFECVSMCMQTVI